jgi:hypothetical protein
MILAAVSIGKVRSRWVKLSKVLVLTLPQNGNFDITTVRHISSLSTTPDC